MVIFIGDDDIFIDKNYAIEYIDAFKNKRVGVARSRQIIFVNNTIKQVSRIEYNGKTKIFKKGLDAYLNFFFDTTSIAGLAFRMNKQLFTLLDGDTSMYPQLELAGKVCIVRDVAQIDKYLIGVRSHEGQLNVLSYSLDGKKTNIVEDFLKIYQRLNNKAKKYKTKIISKREYMNTLLGFLPLFFPYNALKNGKVNTLRFIFDIKKHSNGLFFKPFLLLSLVFILLPNKVIKTLLSKVNNLQLRKSLSNDRIDFYNNIFTNQGKL